MTKQGRTPTSHRKKVIIIALLFITAAAIAISGLLLSIFSLLQNIRFHVLSYDIPGAIFGLVILFLGVRYFLSVRKLKNEVLKDGTTFSWRNFKKESSL